jgi:phospholipid/cholesterol/gamma-HCH transport system ATP-binding protein
MAMVHSGEIILCGVPSEFQSSPDLRVSDFINGVAPVNEDVDTLLGA